MLCRVRCVTGSAAKDDNFVFQLLTRWTVVILVVFSFVITCKLLFGDSIVCVSNDDIPTALLRSHCYASGTFVIRSSWNKVPGRDVPYPGIDRYSPNETRFYLTYYGWVNIVLLVQAFIFYIPRFIWKVYERGFLKKLVTGIDEVSADYDKRNAAIDVLAKYLVASHGKNFTYSIAYICCEVLNNIVAVCQIFWLLHFFGVTGVPEETPEIKLKTWDDFADFYFPLVSKCAFYKYGRSGDTQRHDAMCSVPLNKIYMYVFLFLYSWYVLLAVVSGLNLVYRLSLFIPRVRLLVLRLKAPLTHASSLLHICGRSSFFDWFVLSRVQKNLRQDNFAELIARIVVVNQHSENLDTFEVFHKM